MPILAFEISQCKCLFCCQLSKYIHIGTIYSLTDVYMFNVFNLSP